MCVCVCCKDAICLIDLYLRKGSKFGLDVKRIIGLDMLRQEKNKSYSL